MVPHVSSLWHLEHSNWALCVRNTRFSASCLFPTEVIALWNRGWCLCVPYPHLFSILQEILPAPKCLFWENWYLVCFKKNNQKNCFDETAFRQRKGNFLEMFQTPLSNILFSFFRETYLALKMCTIQKYTAGSSACWNLISPCPHRSYSCTCSWAVEFSFGAFNGYNTISLQKKKKKKGLRDWDTNKIYFMLFMWW